MIPTEWKTEFFTKIKFTRRLHPKALLSRYLRLFEDYQWKFNFLPNNCINIGTLLMVVSVNSIKTVVNIFSLNFYSFKEINVVLVIIAINRSHVIHIVWLLLHHECAEDGILGCWCGLSAHPHWRLPYFRARGLIKCRRFVEN